MNYITARRRLRSGDVVAWTHRGIHSWHDVEVAIVRLATMSEYSHCGVLWRIAGRVFVLDAVSTGVRIFPLSRLLPCFWLRMGKGFGKAAEEFALATVGQPYSKWQAVRAFFGQLKQGRDGYWQCAEHSIALLKANGIELNCRATPSAVVAAAQDIAKGGIVPLKGTA